MPTAISNIKEIGAVYYLTPVLLITEVLQNLFKRFYNLPPLIVFSFKCRSKSLGEPSAEAFVLEWSVVPCLHSERLACSFPTCVCQFLFLEQHIFYLKNKLGGKNQQFCVPTVPHPISLHPPTPSPSSRSLYSHPLPVDSANLVGGFKRKPSIHSLRLSF